MAFSARSSHNTLRTGANYLLRRVDTIGSACLSSDVSLGRISASELKKTSAKAAKIEPGVKGTTEALGGAERYQTFVSTDKPIYRGAETVYVRGVLLNAANHKPLPEEKQTHASIQIKGFSGETIASGNVQTENGDWGCSHRFHLLGASLNCASLK